MNRGKKKKSKAISEKCHTNRCPYCGGPVVLRSADGIYRENKNSTMLYVCSNYPECDAYVRVGFENPSVPIGSLANGNLRALRREAHRYFDQIYESGLMSKADAYAWLSMILAVPKSQAHIGYLGEYYCREVIKESKQLLINNQANPRRFEYQNKMNLGQNRVSSGGI